MMMEAPTRSPDPRSAAALAAALLVAGALAALGLAGLGLAAARPAAAGPAAGLIGLSGASAVPQLASASPAADAAGAALGGSAAGGIAGVPAAGPAAAASPRPFDHAAHEAVPCTSCHGAGDRHRTVLVTATRECAACHHDPAARRACVTCHAVATLPEPGTVARQLGMGVWQEPRRRELPFGHAVHRSVACAECHRGPVTLAADRACGSCHESHHAPTAECGACHRPPGEPVHTVAVHLGCAGAGCHDAARLPTAPFGRATCVGCHPARRDHEPDGDCAACHLLRPPGSP
jgi:hypothetical protein